VYRFHPFFWIPGMTRSMAAPDEHLAGEMVNGHCLSGEIKQKLNTTSRVI
jgi:hypothetical protein